jgi:hypothetical protein
VIKKIAVVLLSVLVCFDVVPVNAQATGVASNTATVSLTANVSESISLTATPASLTFNLSGAASSPITITSTYNVNNTRVWIAVAGYFSSSTALSNSGPVITTSQIFGSMNGGTATACNGGGDLGPVQLTNACPRGTHSFSGVFIGTFTDTLLLSIPGLGTMTPGNYTGVINIVAEAF